MLCTWSNFSTTIRDEDGSCFHSFSGFQSQDVATRVVAEGLRVEQTIMSKIMTRNPTYAMSDTLAIEALQKMVQGMSDALHFFYTFLAKTSIGTM